MANTLTNINLTKVAESCLSALKKQLIPMSAFTLNVDSNPMNKGEAINIPVVTAKAAVKNTTTYETGNSTIVSAQITGLDSYSSCGHITAIESSKTPTDAFEKIMLEATSAVATGIQKAAFELITTAFTSNEVCVATAMDVDKLADMRRIAMKTLKWNSAEKISVVLDGEHYANLIKDPAMRQVSSSGSQVVSTGIAERTMGMDIFESNVIADCDVYAAASTGNSLRGFLCLQSGIAVAIRPPVLLNGGQYDIAENFTDPETGLTLQMRSWVSTATNTRWGAIEVLMGGVACRPTGLLRITAV